MNTFCDLTDRHCKPCEGGVAPLSRAEAEATLGQVPGWELADDARSIHRRFEFKGFYSTMALTKAMVL